MQNSAKLILTVLTSAKQHRFLRVFKTDLTLLDLRVTKLMFFCADSKHQNQFVSLIHHRECSDSQFVVAPDKKCLFFNQVFSVNHWIELAASPASPPPIRSPEIGVTFWKKGVIPRDKCLSRHLSVFRSCLPPECNGWDEVEARVLHLRQVRNVLLYLPHSLGFRAWEDFFCPSDGRSLIMNHVLVRARIFLNSIKTKNSQLLSAEPVFIVKTPKVKALCVMFLTWLVCKRTREKERLTHPSAACPLGGLFRAFHCFGFFSSGCSMRGKSLHLLWLR